jgi:methylthioribose-1-phosphate isomerase
VNGDFANKIGTYSLAVLAKFHGIPFYVCAPYTTVDAKSESGKDIEIEMRNPDEVRGVKGGFGSVIWAPAESTVYNPAFDVTPAELVTAWVLDRGVYTIDRVREGALKSL